MILNMFIVVLCIVSSFGVVVEISNLEVRKDINGDLMDTHDGNIMQWEDGGLYYFYSMGYQDCVLEHGKIPPQECPGIYKPFGTCGFRDDHALRIYNSPDLIHWTLIVEDALPIDKPYGIYFRPKVIFNKLTGLYLLWVNHLPNATTPLVAYPEAVYVVASSPTPAGPFKVINSAANIEISGAGDFDILVDDNAAYLAYDAWGNNHQVVIEQLTDDFTDSLGPLATTGPISPEGNEAPILFKRNEYYYLLYGATCCFCRMGSNAFLWTSKHPLGPWQDTDIDLNPLAISDHNPSTRNHTIKSQNSFTFKVPLVNNTEAILFAGDLWSSAADNLKSHDLQYWQILEFNDSDRNRAPSISQLVFQDSVILDIM